MGERKVQNRYFPPDFDPSLVPRRKWDPYKQTEVRTMIPFNIQCNRCGEFMYRGKKFNARKEDAIGEDYLGIKIYRFYIKCSQCSNEIAFKTDPKNMDYVCELGATRNFESWRQQTEAESEFESKRKEEEQGNAMATLEARTLDSKIEMDILDALDEIKAANDRKAHMHRDPHTILTTRRKNQAAQHSHQDEADIKAFRAMQQKQSNTELVPDDDDDSLQDYGISKPSTKREKPPPTATSDPLLPTVNFKKRRRLSAPGTAASSSDLQATESLKLEVKRSALAEPPTPGLKGAFGIDNSAGGLVVAYASSSSSANES